MKKLTVIMASIVISLPMIASAEGGYQWEKWQNEKAIPVQHLDNSDASKMGHTAVEHKRWLFDDSLPQPADNKKPQTTIRTGEHANHTAAEHKQVTVGN